MTNQVKQGFFHQYGAFLVVLISLLDAALIVGSFLFVLYANGIAFSKDYMLLLLTALLIFMGAGTLQSLYRSQRMTTIRREIGQILVFWGLTIGALAFILYVSGDRLAVDSEVLKFWFFAAPAPLLLTRVLVRSIAHQLRKMGRNFRNVAVIGVTDIGERIKGGIEQNPWMGLKFFGFFDDRSADGDRVTASSGDLEYRSITRLLELIQAGEIDMVYIALPMRAQFRIKTMIDTLSKTRASVYYAPDFFSFELLNARWDALDGQPVISVIESPFVGETNILKRAEDIVLSGAILAVLAAPMLLVALLIRLDSPGPALYKQRRYGLDGGDFFIWKFRTMRQDASQLPFKQATKEDPRITRIGGFLRRYSIDELPQLLNVLQGSMSVIGPRPHPVSLDDEHEELIYRYKLRHKVKPGITGWAQVNGFRGETDELWKMEDRVRYDLEYIDNWSIAFDVKILLMTFGATVSAKNAF